MHSQGCDGGQASGAWHWFKINGVVTGGDYINKDKGISCKPYLYPPCSHVSTYSEDLVSCSTLDSQYTPTCEKTCSESGYNQTSYKSDKHYVKRVYSLSSVQKIQKSIIEKGSVSATFRVHEDFMTYKSGRILFRVI